MEKRIINKVAVNILKSIKCSNSIIIRNPVFYIHNLLIDKAIDYLENNQK